MVTVAILGGGFMGRAHASNYAALGERVRVKSVYSRSAEKAERVSATVGAAASTDLEATIADPEVEAVDICLPTPLHRMTAQLSFDHRKHVFLEKPLALTLEDGEAIVRSAAASGRILMVGLVLRFWPEYVELHRRVGAGELGRLFALAASRLSPPADWAGWYADASQSGGPLVDLMVHDFDQANWLLGEPRSAFARATASADPAYPDHVAALVEYDGAQAVVEGSMALPKSFPFSSLIRAHGEAGAAEYAFRAAPAEAGGNIGVVDESARGLRIYPRGGDPELVLLDPVDPWGPEIEEWVSCLEHGRQPENGTGEQALLALRVSLAARRSLESGRPELP